ncbi:MAG: hypothetical protein KF716_14670 [Anaerolineae bacterium]|nr:hypothetical protein [Anaerolineae bacterium]
MTTERRPTAIEPHKFPTLLLLAVIGALALHGMLLFAGSYRGTYDAYVHIFFADHYRRYWFDLWEPRWYTGFTMVSYPPLTHQLTALLSYPFGLLNGFILVMLFGAVTTTIGVYRFSRLWVSERAATYATVITVFSSSIAETVHVFGQLPTMFVMGVLLNALPFVWKWLEHGERKDLFRGWALLMMAAAGHHVTTLFGMVFFSGPVIATILVRKFRTPRADEPATTTTITSVRGKLRQLVVRRLKRVMPAMIRTGVFGVGLVLILVITVLPYWLWSKSDPITQISIPHASRDSFITNTAAGLMFFLVPWGVLLVVLPYAFYKGFGTANWILAGSLFAVFVFGTGGTTPIPALILRGAYYILTLDRFTFWGTILILPFAGQFVESLLHGRLKQWIAARFGAWWPYGLAALLGAALISMAIFTANLTQFRKFQPDPIDMKPIVEFLAKDNHDQWRFMTLGFGDQMAWLSAQTTALNVEGNYHSARRLPELTSTPVERLDGAKYTSIPGLGSLQQFVTNPQKYNLKYLFVKDAFYEPLLYFAGWYRLQRLDNDVIVWERADVPPVPAAIPAKEYPAWQRLMWGILPVSSIVVTIVVFMLTMLRWPRWIKFKWPFPRLFAALFRLPIVKVALDWSIDLPANGDLPASEEWQIWKVVMRRFFPGLRFTPLARRVTYGLLALLLVIGVVAAGVLAFRRTEFTPQRTLLRYYDALDFRRYTESYTYLQTNLSSQEYLRWLSLRGGIVASFGKLDNLRTEITMTSATTATANVNLDWVTSLGVYTQTTTHAMVLTPDGWKIILDVEPPPLPRETFIRTPALAWFQNLPLRSLDDTIMQRSVIDRSRLSASVSGVVFWPDQKIGFTPTGPDANRTGRFIGLLSVIGSVTNLDPYPSNVTVSAILRDAAGNHLAETNVRDGMIHQLLPGESTPFRVDFSGAEATELTDLSQIASVDVIVKGIPTIYNLERPLVLLEPNLLFNAGANTVDIPRVLAASYEKGTPWVEILYLEASMSPAALEHFQLVGRPATLEAWDIPITVTGPRVTVTSASVSSLQLYFDGFSR